MDFSDDLFETRDDVRRCSKKTEVQCSSYTPKEIEPQWFCCSTAIDTVDTVKRCADFFYYQKDFVQAQRTYQKCLGLMAKDTPSIVRREVEESIALCCMHNGHKAEAQQRLQNLISHSPDSQSLHYHIQRITDKSKSNHLFNPHQSKPQDTKQPQQQKQATDENTHS